MKFPLLLASLLVLVIGRADVSQPSALNEKAADISKFIPPLTLSPPEGAGTIAQLAGHSLERYHFSRMKFRDEISARMFERYIEALDPQKVYFLQSDYDDFSERFKTHLDELTMNEKDVQPAYDIFNRFLQRFDQQYALVTSLLKTEKFTFDGEDRVLVNRKDEERPKDLEAARKLWRDRLRYEYLTEKLTQTEIPALSTNVWRKIAGSSAAAVAGRLSDKLVLPLGTNVLTDLEGLVGKEQSKVIAGKINDGTWKTRSEVETYLRGKLPTEREKDIVEKLTRRYNRTLRTLKQYEPDEVLQLYLDSLAHAYDPHSDYFGKSELDSFSIQMGLTLFGIGATLQSEDGYTVIRSIVPGSPAEKSKQIKIGDKIVAVAQGDDGEWVDVVDEKLKKVVDQIRGPKGTMVRLTIVPAEGDTAARKLVPIIRDEVKLEDSEAKSTLIELPGAGGRSVRVGVIDLPSFYASFPVGSVGRSATKKSTTADVAKLIKKLTAEKAEGIVLDLRRNGGGSLEEAVNLTGLFIKTGPVVQVKQANGRVDQDEDNDPSVLYDGPLIVLTSRFSASASEIVAGALQDYGRALIVGDSSTHGKGTVQNITELGNFIQDSSLSPGAVKLTIRKFYRASGESTQLKGVVPDMVLPSVNNLLDVGEGSLTNALPWDTINAADFEKLNRVQPYLATLKDRSSNRLASDHDWEYVRQDMDLYRKRQAEKSVVLNYTQRLKERDTDKARAEARKKELAARGEKEPTIYQITLKLADQPGLPSPMVRSNVVATSRNDLRLLDKDGSKPDAPTDSATARKPRSSEDEDADADEEPTTAMDVHLREAERILLDYIEASGGGKKGVALRTE